jgi:hypothetical protein
VAASPSLAPALERALVRELAEQWRRLNATYFKGALSPPALELADHEASLGRWTRATRTLELSRPFVLRSSWGVVVEVLKHEMAHQYVSEVLGETSEAPHGRAFRELCERLGVDGRASGVPTAQSGGADGRIVERIARLLALAESPNEHEAQAAALAAQRLMLKHNIDTAARPSSYVFRHLGTPSGRVTEAERIVAMILGRHYFVEVIWVPVYRPLEEKRGSVLEICGTPENVEMAEYVYAFLRHTAEELWQAHRREHGVRSNRDRRSFQAGMMAGFADRLSRDAKAHRAEGLVWLGDRELGGYFRRRHPYVRNVRYAGQPRSEAFGAGREAGRKLVLRRGVSEGSSRATTPLLPSGRR